jgi:hypothetical protein
MKKLVTTALFAAALLAGCGGGGGSTAVSPGSGSATLSSAPRAYNGSASVGDFLTIVLDPVAKTIAYTNKTNGDAATISYLVNADGTFALNDPTGNLQTAYEVPNYGLLIQANKTGPAKNVPSLITAVSAGPVSTATWANKGYNYIQFRTNSGGMEIGSTALDGQGNISTTSYWPYGASSGGNAFGAGMFAAGSFVPDASGTFLTHVDPNGNDTVFGTANGLFAVDTSNGAILGLQKATSKTFSAAAAGTYKVLGYLKSGASTGLGNIETGTAQFVNATMVIGAAATITVTDSGGAQVVQAALTPVADAAYLVGPGKLQDPCFGLFTFRVTNGGSQQDVFVTFQGNTVLFASFTSNGPNSPYSYVYGVGLKSS